MKGKLKQRGGGVLLIVFLILIVLGGGVFVGLGVAGIYDPLKIFGKKKNTKKKDCVGSWSKCVSSSSDNSGSCYKTYTIQTQAGPNGTACPVKDTTKKKCVFPGDDCKNIQKNKCKEGTSQCPRENKEHHIHHLTAAEKRAAKLRENHTDCPDDEKFCDSKCAMDGSKGSKEVYCLLKHWHAHEGAKAENKYLMGMRQATSTKGVAGEYRIDCPTGYVVYDPGDATVSGKHIPERNSNGVNVYAEDLPTQRCVTFIEGRDGRDRDDKLGRCKDGYYIENNTGNCVKGKCKQIKASEGASQPKEALEWVADTKPLDKTAYSKEAPGDLTLSTLKERAKALGAGADELAHGPMADDTEDPARVKAAVVAKILALQPGTPLYDRCTIKSWQNDNKEVRTLYCSKDGTCYKYPTKEIANRGDDNVADCCCEKWAGYFDETPSDWKTAKCPYDPEEFPTDTTLKDNNIQLVKGGFDYTKLNGDCRGDPDNNIETHRNMSLEQCKTNCTKNDKCDGFSYSPSWPGCVLKGGKTIGSAACDNPVAGRGGFTFYRNNRKDDWSINQFGKTNPGLVRITDSWIDKSLPHRVATCSDNFAYMKKCTYWHPGDPQD